MTLNHHSLASHSGWAKKNLRSYVLGFIACLFITFLSFGIVKYLSVSKYTTYALLALFAIIQMIVQSVCFLGLKADTEGKWNLLPFLFSIVIILFLVVGTLWIMYNLNVLMMGSYWYT